MIVLLTGTGPYLVMIDSGLFLQNCIPCFEACRNISDGQDLSLSLLFLFIH